MKQKWVSYPYVLWMAVFIIIPLVLVVYYSLLEGGRFSFGNYRRFIDPIYINILLRSIVLALISTAICLALGYPFAMILSGRDINNKKIMHMLVVLPMWMNFLLRTYAWMTLLERNGVINSILSALSLPQLNILYTEKAVVLGMVYNFIPFMILPIYSVMTKIDRSLIEAAQDLGSNSLTVFRRVIFPLSMPGVVSGITMTFMPAVTTFVISRLLGGGQYTLIGNLIERQYLSSSDWGFGSALSIIMMLMILVSMGIMSRYEKDNEGGALF